MQDLRANTEVIVTVGPFVDVTDGFTPQTDITLGGDEAEIIKHGSTSVVDISGATWAAVTECRGYYSLTLTTSHTNTEGLLVVVVQDDSDCRPVKQEYMVLSEAAYDSLYAAKDAGFMSVDLATANAAALVDDVWDEPLTGGSHNAATSAGRRLRQVSDGLIILHEGTAQAGAATTITLAAGASATDDIYHDAYVSIIAGTGAGQIRATIAYDGASKVLTVSKAWAVNPSSDSEYVLSGSSSVDLHTIRDSLVAVSNLEASATTMVIGTVDDTVAPSNTVFEAADITEATADHFNGRRIIFTSGALQYQATTIEDYELNGGRGKFTVTAMTDTPADSDTFIIV